MCYRNRWSNIHYYHQSLKKPSDPLHTDIRPLVHIGYNNTRSIHFPRTLHKQNEWPDRQSRRIYPAPGRIYAPYSIGSTPLYYITGYPMVSHRTPTYFHSGDNMYIHWSESTRIYHVNVPAANRIPTIYLLSTHSLVMPVVSSHSTSVIIH